MAIEYFVRGTCGRDVPLAWLFLLVVHQTVSQNSREGWLLFKCTNLGANLQQAWTDTAKSDMYEPDRYRWDLRYMIEDYTQNGMTDVFRSPLLEHWQDMEPEEITIIMMNAVGEELHAFHFDLQGTAAEQDNFNEYLVDDIANTPNIPSPVAQLWSSHGMTFGVHSGASDTDIKFLALNVDLTGSIGEKFLLATGNGGQAYASLPPPDHVGCYEVAYLSTDTPVVEMYECVNHCLGSPDPYIALYAVDDGSQVQAFCRCLPSLSITVVTSCNYLCFHDDQQCGKLVDASHGFPKYIEVSVYSINHTRQYLQSSWDKTNISSWQEYKFNPTIDTKYSAAFGEVRYIRKIAVVDYAHTNFTLAVMRSDCTDSNLFNPDDYEFYGDAVDDIKVFTADGVIDLEPVPASCVLVNFTETMPDMQFLLSFQFITSDFVMAEYLGIMAAWQNRECTYSEVMTMIDVITTASVTVSYGSGTDLVLDGGRFNMTQGSEGRVVVRFPAGVDDRVEYWVNKVTVVAPIPITVNVQIVTNRNCTDHATEGQVPIAISNWYFLDGSLITPAQFSFSDITNSRGMFCGDWIDLQIQVKWDKVTNANALFNVNVSINGCALHRGANASTADACNQEDFVELSSLIGQMNTRLVPLNDHVLPLLRPSGGGMMLVGGLNPEIRVILSEKYLTELLKVVVITTGVIDRAKFSWGGSVTSVDKGTVPEEPENLVFIPSTGVRGRELVINNFVASSELFSVVLRINVCTNALGYFSTTVTSISTSTTKMTTPTPGTTTTTTTTTTATKTTQGSTTTTLTSGTTTPSGNSGYFSTTATSTSTSTTKMTTTPTPGTTTTTKTTQGSTTTTTTGTTTPPGNSGCPSMTGCLCPPAQNLTQAQLDSLVKDLIANLTVPKTDTSKFKRTLISAPDERTSATYIGCTCGAVTVSLCGLFIVVMDLEHIKTVFEFTRTLLMKFI